MIIFRYMAREVFSTTLVVTVVLLAISLGGRVIAYLQGAAAGLFAREALIALIGYRVPGLLEIVIPVAFFLGIMLGYGRLHMDSEMVVLTASGLGPRRVIGYTFVLSLCIAAIVASISLVATPWAQQQIERIRQAQDRLTEFDLLIPGRFQSMSGGERVTYTQAIAKESREMETVFVVERQGDELTDPGKVDVVLAKGGHQQVDQSNGNRFLVLRNGSRSIGIPGNKGYRTISYEEFGQLIKNNTRTRPTKAGAMATGDLLWQDDLRMQSELQWRLSIILLVPIAALMAIPLSQVNPRQGRFARLVPGLILIFLYLVLLSISRTWVEKAQIPPWAGLWWVHLLFVAIALLLFQSGPLLDRIRLGFRESTEADST